jgi:hypothetical protein
MTNSDKLAQSLLSANPALTVAQVRMAVLQSTGEMLTAARITAAKTASKSAPHLGDSRSILIAEGFLASEADDLLKGLHVSIDSPAVLAMRKARIEWFSRMTIPREVALDRIATFYSTNSKRSVFDFLRREYKPAAKVARADYAGALQRRRIAQQATRSLYGSRHR